MTKRPLSWNRWSSVTQVCTSQDIAKFITKGNATWRGPCRRLTWVGVIHWQMMWQVMWRRPLWQMTWLLPHSGRRGICHAGRWCGVCHVSFTGPTTWIISNCATCLPLKCFFVTKHVHFHHGKHSYRHRRHQKTSLYLVFFHHRSTIAQITYNSDHTQLRSHSRS